MDETVQAPREDVIADIVSHTVASKLPGRHWRAAYREPGRLEAEERESLPFYDHTI